MFNLVVQFAFTTKVSRSHNGNLLIRTSLLGVYLLTITWLFQFRIYYRITAQHVLGCLIIRSSFSVSVNLVSTEIVSIKALFVSQCFIYHLIAY